MPAIPGARSTLRCADPSGQVSMVRTEDANERATMIYQEQAPTICGRGS